MLPGLAWLLFVSLLPSSSEGPCVNATGCMGCGGSTVDCRAFALAEFPRISVEDAGLVESL